MEHEGNVVRRYERDFPTQTSPASFLPPSSSSSSPKTRRQRQRQRRPLLLSHPPHVRYPSRSSVYPSPPSLPVSWESFTERIVTRLLRLTRDGGFLHRGIHSLVLGLSYFAATFGWLLAVLNSNLVSLISNLGLEVLLASSPNLYHNGQGIDIPLGCGHHIHRSSRCGHLRPRQ